MEEIHHLARERIGMASEKMKTRYDARATGHNFHEGNKAEKALYAEWPGECVLNPSQKRARLLWIQEQVSWANQEWEQVL
ncbi:hypothetical protein TNCV_3697911 [Trichonephila clavipes]|uniref:Uncharacterized protein n=1 Tax=Trichonephila clavipes TaxID=2585209 RepID=A0A8X6VEM4_TRICX|nr:hypothetical protein TNCV_3697911 [Trichonephila clavipes]